MPDAAPEPDHETAPSGKKASGYGEVMVRVWFTGPPDSPHDGAEAMILAPDGLPFPFWMISTEHMMTATAKMSKAGFERAIELLAEGAISNRGKMLGRPAAAAAEDVKDRVKTKVDAILAEQTAKGNLPKLVTFPSQEVGASECRGCGAAGKDGQTFVIGVFGTEIEEDKVFAYCIAMMCDDCVKNPATPGRMTERVGEWYRASRPQDGGAKTSP